MSMKQCTCGYVGNSKFCPECGAPLNLQPSNPGQVQKQTVETPKEPINIFPDDTGLKLLVNTYSKRILGIGESYWEEVLYIKEDTGEYQVHTYARASGQSESHLAYTIDRQAAEAIARIPIQEKLAAVSEQQKAVVAPTGSSQVIRFLNEDGNIFRMEANFGESYTAYHKLSECLRAYCKMENMIVPEYAQGWKSLTIQSTKMNMDGCYRFSIEKNDAEDIRVKGSFFQDGQKRETIEWVTLTEEQKQALLKIPFGMLLSTREKLTHPMPGSMAGMNMPMGMHSPMGMMGMGAGMADGPSYSCLITYGDGRTDSKQEDQKMMQKLLEVCGQVF